VEGCFNAGKDRAWYLGYMLVPCFAPFFKVRRRIVGACISAWLIRWSIIRDPGDLPTRILFVSCDWPGEEEDCVTGSWSVCTPATDV
jgi:hypothetical protein